MMKAHLRALGNLSPHICSLWGGLPLLGVGESQWEYSLWTEPVSECAFSLWVECMSQWVIRTCIWLLGASYQNYP